MNVSINSIIAAINGSGLSFWTKAEIVIEAAVELTAVVALPAFAGPINHVERSCSLRRI